MSKEAAEVIYHHRDRDDDSSNKVRQCDDSGRWTVESYEAKTTRAMVECGARQLPSRLGGRLFEVDARQLIEFIAASSGLVVEFRKHKKRQLSEETKAKLAERLTRMRQHQTA